MAEQSDEQARPVGVDGETRCHYCGEQIILRHLGGYGDFWLRWGGAPPYEGRAVCSGRDDDGHSPVEENEDD